MTLEASLVIPMALCVVALLIYFSYYLYGRCMLSQDTYILAFRAANTDVAAWKNDPGAYIAEKGDEKLGAKYFGSTKPGLSAEKRGSEVRVSGKTEGRHRAMGSYFLKPQTGWDYEAAGKAKRRDYPLHIRRIKRLMDLGKEIIGNNNGE
ncbi:MAG: hypothetical protein K6G10_12920 [Butyrivibrio sp.]|nr:hypothetical protein [Butyrivibrio sp.]